MIKLKDVARRAGVSEATASLVMNERPGVNAQTRQRVLRAARSLGYTPNNIARGLAMRKSHTIGLVVTDVENPYFGSLTRYIDEAARNEGYNLILSVSNDDLALEDTIITNFIGKRVDGVVVVPSLARRTDYSCYQKLVEHRIPYVFSTTFYPGVKADCVMTDLEEGSYELTKYLIGLGHRCIVFLVSAWVEAAVSSLRIRGYARAFLDSGIRYEEDCIIACGHPDFTNGYSTTLDFLESREPDAIIAINDITALGAKRAVKEKGYRIPEDISVAGYDDVIFSSIPEIPLTTVRQNISGIAAETVKMLMGRMRGEGGRERIVKKLRPELVIRNSTGECRRRAAYAAGTARFG
jgi:LacI family transcriptional regulator